MANNTSRGITYPTSGDSISPLETVFATLASTTNTAMGNLDAGDIKTGALAIARGGTGSATAAAALIALNGVSSDGYDVAGKNKIINSDFSVWQRASTATTLSTTGYFADRWRYMATGGTSKVFSQSRQAFTPGSQPETGYEGKYFYRVAVTTAGSGYTSEYVEQPIEDVRTLAGKKVVLSFWAKVSTGTMTLSPRLVQYFGTGGSPSTSVTSSFTSQSVGVGWTRFTTTLTTTENRVPNLSGKTIGTNDNSYLALQFVMPNNAIQTLDLWGVQLEEGTVVSRFSTNSANQGDELDSCQRYYWRLTNDSSTGATLICAGTLASTTAFWGVLQYPVKMRAVPTFTSSTVGTTNFVVRGSVDLNVSALSIAEAGTNTVRVVATPATGTAGQGAFLRFATAINTGWIDFTSEL